ncbi:unnamed protein product [Parajaminaea phylloscopi]
MSDSSILTFPSSNDRPTRTVAVLTRACAKVHRLAIESKITAAGFDILIARQEEWAYPDDLDFLSEFFHGHTDDAARKWMERLTGSTIHFMVLERPDAVRAWQRLMGPSDVDDDEDGGSVEGNTSTQNFRNSIASNSSFTSGLTLREAHGLGALYGSITRQQAERQIAICAPEFASEEAMADLSIEYSALIEEEDEGGDEEELDPPSEASHGMSASHIDPGTHAPEFGAAASIRQEDVTAAQQQGCLVISEAGLVYDEAGQAFDQQTGAAVQLEEELLPDSHVAEAPHGAAQQAQARADQHKVFKARPIPASIAAPKVQPRLSRAAALRMGIELPAVPVRVTKAATEADTGPVGISGLPKAAVALPKSLAAPSIQPRANRASLARTTGTSINPSSQATREGSPARPRKQVDFSSTPGHKRQSLLPKGEQSAVASLAKPTIAPRQNRASLARAAGGLAPAESRTRALGRTESSPVKPTTSHALPRTAAMPSHQRKQRSADENIPPKEQERKPVQFDDTPGHRRRSLAGSFNLASLKAPTIAPRGNRASLARCGQSGEAAGPPVATSAPRVRAHTTATASETVSSRSASPEKRQPMAARERRAVDFSSTPGHKRTGSAMAIASLAAPKIAPRSNLAATRRLSLAATSGPLLSAQLRAAAPGRPTSAMGDGSKPTNAPRARPSSSAGIRAHAGGAHQDGHTPSFATRFQSAADPGRGKSHPPSAFKATMVG